VSCNGKPLVVITGVNRGGKPELPDPDKAKLNDTAQRNITDPESRIMPDGANKGSFVQGYNAQIAANLEQKPEMVSADTGYFSEANVTDESVKDVDLYVATGRDKHGDVMETNSDPPLPGASPKEAVREKLRTEAGRAVYKMRKAIVEPVF
jgi:hypothetical protein